MQQTNSCLKLGNKSRQRSQMEVRLYLIFRAVCSLVIDNIWPHLVLNVDTCNAMNNLVEFIQTLTDI